MQNLRQDTLIANALLLSHRGEEHKANPPQAAAKETSVTTNLYELQIKASVVT